MKLKVVFVAQLLFSLWLFTSLAEAQQIKEADVVPIPSTEKFVESDGLLEMARRAHTKSYDEVTEKEIARVYNADGTVWWQFRFFGKEMNFRTTMRSEVKEFAAYDYVAFRVKAVSKHWYEVDINEDTGLTKFVSKNDEAMGYRTFEQVFEQNHEINFDRDSNPVRVLPNGELAEVTLHIHDKFLIEKMEGDWMLIKATISGSKGWIKWRNPRKMIVGHIYNRWKVPK